ncbi:MAG: hypothetical protein R2800_00800 [Flavipsychrobacter sp.]
MPKESYIYTEALTKEEYAFLEKKAEKEGAQFYKVARVLMAFCFIIPFIFAWFQAAEGDEIEIEIAFSYARYFFGVLFLLVFAGSIMFVSYKRNLGKLHADLKDKLKVIERTYIKRKQYMPHNNSYYFYLESPNKLSIEVRAQDFNNYANGDELNIEYAAHSKFYFSYF